MENKTELKQNQKMKAFCKVMGCEMITVPVGLYSPYVEFAKEYMRFFNIKDDLSIFLMRLVYDGLERLQRDLTEFVHDKESKHFVDGTAWYNKNPHVACTSFQEPDEEQ
jgi:hypothetical protein